MPRKNGFSVPLVVVVLAAASFFLWLHGAERSPDVASPKQITRDGLVKTNLTALGSDLYFTEISDGRYVISKVASTGGNITQFPVAFASAQLLDVSAVRSSVLAAENKSGAGSDYPFWIYPLKGGAAQRFGELSGREAVWSPDGQQVVFAKGSALYVAGADGKQAKELANVQGTPYYPRYSPDGKRIRFSVGDAARNTSSLWEANSDGSGLHALLANWNDVASKCCGSWTANGRYYIFQATGRELGSNADLWAVSEDKSVNQPIQLTEGAVSFGRPVPSADNKKIWSLGLNLRGTVVKYDPASDRYVPFLAGISASDLDFSADGKWVTYVSIPEGALWRCRVDGSDRKQLTFAPARAALPRWSPDGKRIAFVDVEKGKPWAITIVPAEGGTPQSLVSENLTQVDINWTLDGSKIIFGRVTEFKPEGLSIRVYDLKTHQLSTIPGSEGLFSPRLSPDGHYIAALTANLTKLMLYDSSHQKWSEWQNLPSGALNYPAWSADSKSIYFDDLVSGEAAYCRAKVGASSYEHVFLLKDLERYLGPFGLWAGRAPDGSVLFVQDASTREIYELQVNLP